MDNMSKYLKLTAFLRKRYSVNGWLVVNIGDNPSIFTKLEDLAAKKYLGIDRSILLTK